MTRTLTLLRHAKAESFAASDAERPLALRGRRQAADVGQQLAEGDALDLALVSGALRTRQTWELLAAQLPQPPAVEILDDLYDATARTALELINEVDDGVAHLLVVGHEPVMSSLAAALSGASSDEGAASQVRLGIPTATRCVLEVDGSWADLTRGGARLVAVVRATEDT